MTEVKSYPGPAVDVILPCLDEAQALPVVLARLPTDYRAIVVDNGSRDDSAAVAARLGATVVHEPRQGYGSAVHTGLTSASAEFVAVLDCDGSLDPADLIPMVDRLVAGTADLVCGRRVSAERGAWPVHARLANRLLAGLLSIGVGLPVGDIAPMRVARREELLGLEVSDRRCGYPLQTLLLARRAGWRIIERDVPYRRRAAGTRSKISGTVRGTWTVARDFLAVLIMDRRRRQHGLRVGTAA